MISWKKLIFKLKGPAIFENKKTIVEAEVVEGKAVVKLQSTNKAGKVIIEAVIEGIIPGKGDVVIRWIIPGLINFIGGRANFVKKLDQYFLENRHNPGNEPDFINPFLSNYAGATRKTQEVVKNIIVKGGILKLVMGSTPNKEWGSLPENAPPSISKP